MRSEDTLKRPSVDALKLLEAHLAERDFLVGDRYTSPTSRCSATSTSPARASRWIASCCPARWLERITQQPRFMNDLSRFLRAPGRESRSIYDG